MNRFLSVSLLLALCTFGYAPSDKYQPNINSLEHQTMTSAVKASVELLELYNTPIPPPGASADYPKSHSVIKVEFQNTTMTPVYINQIKLRLVRASNRETIASKLVSPSTLLGLQIEEKGNHIGLTMELSKDEEYKVLMEYIIDDGSFLVESNQLRPLTY
jgi:hypothetical protein